MRDGLWNRRAVGSNVWRIVMVLRAVGRPSQLMDDSEWKREKRKCVLCVFCGHKTRSKGERKENVFYWHKTRTKHVFFSLSLAPSHPSAVMDGPQRERPCDGPSRVGTNPNPWNRCVKSRFPSLSQSRRVESKIMDKWRHRSWKMEMQRSPRLRSHGWNPGRIELSKLKERRRARAKKYS